MIKGEHSRSLQIMNKGILFRLVRVDWEINNHIGVFTRDVMVLYAEERTDDGYKINGYTFTEPDITRVGINFKWSLLAASWNLTNLQPPLCKGCFSNQSSSVCFGWTVSSFLESTSPVISFARSLAVVSKRKGRKSE